MSKIFSEGDKYSSPQEESRNILGESLTSLAWLHHLNVAALIPPCGKYDDCEEPRGLPSIKGNTIKLPSSSEVRQCNTNKSEKPPFPYTTLIGMAFQAVKCERLNVGQICDWISTHFSFYQSGSQMWQNCVRHTLQQNKFFERIRKKKDEPHRGVFWRICDHVRLKNTPEEDQVLGTGSATKRKRTGSMFCTENYLIDDAENIRNQKFRSRSLNFAGGSDDFGVNFVGDDCSYLNDYSWDSLMEGSGTLPQSELQKTGDKYTEDWFPSYEMPTCDSAGKPIFEDFERASPVYDEFDETKISFPDFYLGGEYCENTDIPEFTSAIHFDPLLSSTWSTNTQSSDSSREGVPHFVFNEGVHYK